jgi:hypothetical protein
MLLEVDVLKTRDEVRGDERVRGVACLGGGLELSPYGKVVSGEV